MESPNNGHIGFVRCREMSAPRRLFNYYYMCGKLIPFHKVCPLYVEELSAFRSVRFGILHCIYNYILWWRKKIESDHFGFRYVVPNGNLRLYTVNWGSLLC